MSHFRTESAPKSNSLFLRLEKFDTIVTFNDIYCQSNNITNKQFYRIRIYKIWKIVPGIEKINQFFFS